MTTFNSTAAKIHEWVTKTFPLAQQREVELHDSLLGSGIIDSLGTLEVVRFLEDEFAIQVTDDEMLADHFESIQAIADLVDSKNRTHVADARAV